MSIISDPPPTALLHCADCHTEAEHDAHEAERWAWEQEMWEGIQKRLPELEARWAQDPLRDAVWEQDAELAAEDDARWADYLAEQEHQRQTRRMRVRRGETREEAEERWVEQGWLPAPRTPEPEPAAEPVGAPRITQAALQAAAAGGLMLEVALAYGSLGLPVLPLWHLRTDLSCACERRYDCPAPGKHPRNPSGSRGATTSSREIRGWWTTAPAASVGIATGHGIDVIDCDGAQALEAAQDLHAAERLPRVLASARTGREGGVHLLIASSGQGNRSTGVPHLDFRGAGGYIVGAPSMHQSGRTYRWAEVSLDGGDDLAGAALDAPGAGWPWEGSGRRRARSERTAPLTAAGHLSVQVQTLLDAGEGHTTTTLHRCTSRVAEMVRLGALSAAEVSDALTGAYASAGGSKPDDVVRGLIATSLLSSVGLPRWAESMTLAELIHGRQALRRSVSETLDALWALHCSPDSERFISNPLDRDVLHALLTEADERGSLRLTMSRRHLAGLMGRIHRDGVATALTRLEAAGVLTELVGSRRTGAAGRITLSTSGLSDAGPTPVGSGTATCPMPGQPSLRDGEVLPLVVARHRTKWVPLDVMVGARRGQGQGLTITDRALLQALPSDQETAKTATWAQQAGVARSTAALALTTSHAATLASQGLVQVAGRGLLRGTPRGQAVAADLRGDAGADGEALADLERNLKVVGRQKVVKQRHDAASTGYALRFAPVLLSRVVRGSLWDDAEQHEDERARASVTDLPRLKKVLGPRGQWESLMHALRVLDGQGGQEVRRAAAVMVRGVITGKPTPDADALLGRWVNACDSEEPSTALHSIRRIATALRPAQGTEAEATRAAEIVGGRRAVRHAGTAVRRG